MDWTPVEKAAKDDAGNFRVLVGGKWIPASKVAKNDSGQYVAMMDSAPDSRAAEIPTPYGQPPLAQPAQTQPSAEPRKPLGTSFIERFLTGPLGAAGTLGMSGLASIPAAGIEAVKGPEAAREFFRNVVPQPGTESGREIVGSVANLLDNPILSRILPALPGLSGELQAMSALGKPKLPPMPSVSLPEAVTKPVTKVGDWVKTATGAKAKEAARSLQEQTSTLTERKAAEAAARAQPAQRELSSAEKALQQLGAQPKVAAKRAKEKALDPEKVAAEQAAVREKQAAKARAAESEHRRAGMNAEQAKQAVADAESRVAQAQQGVDALDAELAAKPGMTKDEFGERVRNITEQLRSKYEGERERGSGLKTVLAQAGEEPRVETKPVIQVIKELRKGIKNPSLEAVLDRIESTIGESKLSLEQAQSFKTYLDSIIETKQIKDIAGNAMAVDKSTAIAVQDIKSALMKSATEPGDEFRSAYANAIKAYRDLSRPLDIVERKGALRPVLDTDPISSAYKMSEAEVADHIIKKANAGHPAFERLLKESPELKDSARLAFARDLFGTDSPTKLDTWLKQNERALRQTGLYDEFKTIKSAKDAAQMAVEQAKGAVKETKTAAGQAAQAEAAAAKTAGRATKLSKESEKRLETTLKGVQRPEDIMKPSIKRAEAKRAEFEAAAKKAGRTIEQHQKVVDRFSTLETEVKSATPKQTAAKVRETAKKMVDEKLITQDEYGHMLEQANKVEKAYGDIAKVRREMRHIGAILGISAGFGYGAYHLGAAIPG